jgi:hypothetical protein
VPPDGVDVEVDVEVDAGVLLVVDAVLAVLAGVLLCVLELELLPQPASKQPTAMTTALDRPKRFMLHPPLKPADPLDPHLRRR